MKDTKSWILDAAAMLFTQNGFNSTTTRAIAELAGVSESTFFRIYVTVHRYVKVIVQSAEF